MRFQVPQFIEIEDKIFGPLTFKQFIYLAGGAGICVVVLSFFPKFIAILISLPVAVFAAALAFYRPNSKPFVSLVEASIAYFLGSKLYIWKKEERVAVARDRSKDNAPAPQVYVPKLSESKLAELSFALDIKQTENASNQDTL